MSDKKVRVRFAPSPTGPLHIGGLRTALFNYLFAKKNNGTFILRIEDTDQTRFVPKAEEYIIESLKWCNILFDEGVGIGGEYGPYKQSERKELYKKYAIQLIESGHAYYAFDTPSEIEAMREKLKAEKSSTQQYNAITRGDMKNSLTIASEDVEQRLKSGEAYIIRFKMPDEHIDITVIDKIRGTVVINTAQLDDKVLFKSDGMPTYHLANVVDDYLMKISHVIRGEEWLPSLPLHVLLYDAFGWKDAMPEFAHLPLLLKPNGKGKLSKRDGDKMGFPVFPLQWIAPNGEISSGYKESGYFADAFINMLAFLGWNPGTEQEIFSLKQLSDVFTLDRVGKSGAKFDPEKAKWFNHQYLVEKSNEELAELYQIELKEKGIEVSNEFVVKVCGLIKERADFVKFFWEQSSYLFVTPESYDPKVVKKRWKEQSPEIITAIKGILQTTEPFDAATTENVVKSYIQEKELGMGAVMNAFRLTLVGGGFGAGVFDIVEIIGKEETIKRLENGLNNIKK